MLPMINYPFETALKNYDRQINFNLKRKYQLTVKFFQLSCAPEIFDNKMCEKIWEHAKVVI